MRPSNPVSRLVFAVLGLLGCLAAGVWVVAAASPSAPADGPLWQRVLDGLFGDRVLRVAFVGEPGAASRSMLLLPEGNGLFRLNVEAGSWDATAANPDKPAAVVRSLAVLPGDAQGLVAYAGLEGRTLFARTENAGYNWQALAGPAGPRRLDLLAVTKSGSIYAAEAGSNSLFVSADRGDTWAPKAGPPPGAGLKALIAASDEGVVYALANGHLYRMEPTPSGWVEVLGPTTTPPMNVLVAAAGARGRLYAAGAAGGNYLALGSEDRGATWPSTGWPQGATAEPRVLEASDGSGGIPQVHLGLADGGVYQAQSGATNWQVVDHLPLAVTALRYDPATAELWAGSDGLGLFRTGANPVQTGAVPLDMLSVIAPAYAEEGRLLGLARVLPERREGTSILPPVDGLYESFGGDRWSRKFLTDVLGSTLIASPAYATDRRVYSGQRVSYDAGNTWDRLDPPPGEAAPHVLAVGPITGTLPVVYALKVPYVDGNGGSGLLLSEDGGASWVATDVSVDHIVDLVVSPRYPIDRRAWFITETGSVYRTTDGTGFTQIGQVPAAARQRIVYDLVMSPAFASDSTLFVAAEDPASPQQARVFLSTNAGVGTWQDRSRGLPARARPRALVLSPGFQADGTMFVGTERRVGDSEQPSFFSTATAGEDWYAESLLPPSFVHQFAWVGTLPAGRLFAAAGAAGLWVRTLDGPPSAQPTATRTATATATGGATATATETPSASPSPTGIGPSDTPGPGEPTLTATATTSATPSATASATPSATPSATEKPVTPTPSPTATRTVGGSTIHLPFLQKPRGR